MHAGIWLHLLSRDSIAQTPCKFWSRVEPSHCLNLNICPLKQHLSLFPEDYSSKSSRFWRSWLYIQESTRDIRPGRSVARPAATHPHAVVPSSAAPPRISPAQPQYTPSTPEGQLDEDGVEPSTRTHPPSCPMYTHLLLYSPEPEGSWRATGPEVLDEIPLIVSSLHSPVHEMAYFIGRNGYYPGPEETLNDTLMDGAGARQAIVTPAVDVVRVSDIGNRNRCYQECSRVATHINSPLNEVEPKPLHPLSSGNFSPDRCNDVRRDLKRGILSLTQDDVPGKTNSGRFVKYGCGAHESLRPPSPYPNRCKPLSRTIPSSACNSHRDVYGRDGPNPPPLFVGHGHSPYREPPNPCFPP
ncbi:hypothetical protein ACRALDRAFT_2017723 [Sodiomyces alcalophilus JCM 7366]|uniref:uncharacterized protein n=1 Tax=Sodiomyces alcalophilus JCM 7366 TaxID=591952 RepID=UPI0039B3FD88